MHLGGILHAAWMHLACVWDAFWMWLVREYADAGKGIETIGTIATIKTIGSMTNGYLCYASFVPPWREALRQLRRGKPSLFVKDTLRKLRYDLGGSLSRGPSPEILADHMRFSGGMPA